METPITSPIYIFSDTLLWFVFLQVESWLEDLLWEKKSIMDIYRCKGILYIHDSDQVHTLQVVTSYKESERTAWSAKSYQPFFVFPLNPIARAVWLIILILLQGLSVLMSDFALMQAVREVYEVVPARKWSETESRMNKIVVIGKTSKVKTQQFSTCKFWTGYNLCLPILLQAAIWISMYFKILLVVARADNEYLFALHNVSWPFFCEVNCLYVGGWHSHCPFPGHQVPSWIALLFVALSCHHHGLLC